MILLINIFYVSVYVGCFSVGVKYIVYVIMYMLSKIGVKVVIVNLLSVLSIVFVNLVREINVK